MNETRKQTGSVTNSLPNDHLRALIPSIIARRAVVGASTPTGRRLSTLIEQIENGVSPHDTLRELDQLGRDGGEFVYANHGAAR